MKTPTHETILGLNTDVLEENYYTAIDSLNEFLIMAWNILAVLAITWVVGKIAQITVGTLLRLLRFDALADRLKAGELLRKIGVDNLPSYVVANVVYWLILMFGAVVSLTSTRLSSLMTHLNEILMFIPQALSALLILVITRYIALFFCLATRGVLTGAGISHGDRYGWAMFAAFWTAGVMAAAYALGFDSGHMLFVAEIASYAAAVGLAVFFATGAWTAAREITYGFFVRARISPGDEIYVDGIPGTVKRFLGFSVEIYQTGNVLLLPYSKAGADAVKKKVI